MDSTETTKVVLDLDNQEFVDKLKESLGLLGELGNVESLEGLASTFLRIGMVAGVVAGAIGAVKMALDMTKESEHIKQVNATFEMLANSAGVAAEVIKDQLVKAAGGMADATTILQSANKAMLVLGDNTKKMPEIMELARKYTAAFGGDVTEVFEGMSRAMAMGNARMLRQYGITVQADKAHKDFAASIGVGVGYLDQAGQKQAVFNAALEQAHKNLDGVDISIAATTNSLKKIGTSFTEIKEMAILAWDAVAGPTVVKLVGQMSDTIHGWAVSMKAMFGTGKEQADATKESLERQITQYKTLIAQTNGAFNPGQLAEYNMHLKAAEEQLGKINAKEEKSAELELHKKQLEKKEGPDSANDKSKFINQEKLRADKQKFEGEILKLHQDRVKAEEAIETKSVGFQKIRDEEIAAAAAKANLKIKQLDKALYTDKLITESQHSKAVMDIQHKMDADITQIRLKSQQDELQALKNLEKQTAYTAAGFSNSWKKNSAQAADDLKNFAKLGDMSFSSVGKNAAAAFQAMGDGSKSAGDAMKGFLFGTIGDVAIAQGTMHLLAGIWPPNPIELAEGAALIALGGALKSVGTSSGASAPSASAGSGGSSSIGSQPATAAQASTPAPLATPQKSVSINIQGSLFETDQTRNRLMAMIREAGDFTDFNLKQVGQP